MHISPDKTPARALAAEPFLDPGGPQRHRGAALLSARILTRAGFQRRIEPSEPTLILSLPPGEASRAAILPAGSSRTCAILIAHALERGLQEGAGAFDFLRGQEPYKTLWRATAHPTCRLTIWRD